MSLAGKLLAILNVLAAVGFGLLAGLDWQQHERWAYTVYRHDLFVDGLPIDDKEKDSEQKPRVDKFDEPWFADMFKRAGGQPVKTQAEEVGKLRTLIDDKVASPEVPGTRSQKLARFVRALARTQSEREALTRQMADDKTDNEEALKKTLQDHFDSVNENAADHKRSLDERKANAARLLFCLRDALQDPQDDFLASNDYQRFLVVVGLSGAARAADDQAVVLLRMTEDTIHLHEAERSQFVYQHGQAVELGQALADAVDNQTGKLKFVQNEVAKLKLAVDDHRLQIQALVLKLEQYRKETRDNLDKQTQAEQDVMARLVELRDTAKRNQELEREIRQLEGLPAAK